MMLMINDDYCINENMIIDATAYDKKTSDGEERIITFNLLGDINGDFMRSVDCSCSKNKSVASHIKDARKRFAEAKSTF